MRGIEEGMDIELALGAVESYAGDLRPDTAAKYRRACDRIREWYRDAGETALSRAVDDALVDIYLQPTVYTFRPGHKAVLVVTGWDPCQLIYVSNEIDAEDLVASTLAPRFAYSFDIDNASLEFRLPKEPHAR